GPALEFVATLAFASARPRACICATPRSQRDARAACLSRPRPACASVTMVGEPKAPGATIWGLLSMKLELVPARPPACTCGALRCDERKISWGGAETISG